MNPPRENLLQALGNRRILASLLLGFSSGLPNSLVTGAAVQAWLKDSDIDIKTIGAFTLCGLPYTWKFFWAPIVDRYALPWLGRRRGWILMSQLLLTVCMALYAVMEPKTELMIIAALVFAVAFFSATQDIAFDAYRRDILLPEERGIGSAAMVTGYRIAIIVSGSLTLIAADKIGWQLTFVGVAMVMLLSTFATFFAPEPVEQVNPPRTLSSAVIEPLREFVSRSSSKIIILLLLSILLYKVGDALALSLSTPFLKSLGFTNTDVGTVSKGFGMAAGIAGGALGGLIMVRIGLYRSLLWMGVAQAVTIVPYIWLAQIGHSYPVLVVAIGIQNFGDGMGTAAFVALLTALCDVRFSAFQYALFSALSLQGRMLLGPVAGAWSHAHGWVSFFGLCLLVSVPGMLLIIRLRSEIMKLDERVTA